MNTKLEFLVKKSIIYVQDYSSKFLKENINSYLHTYLHLLLISMDTEHSLLVKDIILLSNFKTNINCNLYSMYKQDQWARTSQ
jgi:hypothetical protein